MSRGTPTYTTMIVTSQPVPLETPAARRGRRARKPRVYSVL
jgi:hypothetical protein